MVTMKKILIILCVLLLIFLTACKEKKDNGDQSAPISPTNQELLGTPQTTAKQESPATPEPMEGSVIPDEENVSRPDPG